MEDHNIFFKGYRFKPKKIIKMEIISFLGNIFSPKIRETNSKYIQLGCGNNIAEGFERSSNADFSRFLYFSLGSVSEVRSMLYLAIRLELINSEKSKLVLDATNQISKMLYGLLNSMNKKLIPNN